MGEESQHAFYISFPEGQMTRRLEGVVVDRGWSWNRHRGLAFISNAVSAAFGLPPNPILMNAPSSFAYLRAWSLGSPVKRPRESRARRALKGFCLGHAHHKGQRQTDQSVQPPGRFFYLGKYLPARFSSRLEEGACS